MSEDKENINPAISNTNLTETVQELSAEEFQRTLSRWFDSRGIVSELRTHLRRLMIEVLTDTSLGRTVSQSRTTLSPKMQVFNLLIAEFLLKYKYQYSLSVFSTEVPFINILPEYSSSFDNVRDACIPHSNNKDLNFTEQNVWDILQTIGFTKNSPNSQRLFTSYFTKSNDPLLICMLELLVTICDENQNETETKKQSDTKKKTLTELDCSKESWFKDIFNLLLPFEIPDEILLLCRNYFKNILEREQERIQAKESAKFNTLQAQIQKDLQNKEADICHMITEMENTFFTEKRKMLDDLAKEQEKIDNIRRILYQQQTEYENKLIMLDRKEELLRQREGEVVEQAEILKARVKVMQNVYDSVIEENEKINKINKQRRVLNEPSEAENEEIQFQPRIRIINQRKYTREENGEAQRMPKTSIVSQRNHMQSENLEQRHVQSENMGRVSEDIQRNPVINSMHMQSDNAGEASGVHLQKHPQYENMGEQQEKNRVKSKINNIDQPGNMQNENTGEEQEEIRISQRRYIQNENAGEQEEIWLKPKINSVVQQKDEQEENVVGKHEICLKPRSTNSSQQSNVQNQNSGQEKELQSEYKYLKQQLQETRETIKQFHQTISEENVSKRVETEAACEERLLKGLLGHVQEENSQLKLLNTEQQRRLDELSMRNSILMTDLENSQTTINILSRRRMNAVAVPALRAPVVSSASRSRPVSSYLNGGGENSGFVPHSSSPPAYRNLVHGQVPRDLRRKVPRRLVVHSTDSSDETSHSPTDEILQEAKLRLRRLEEETEAVDRNYRAFKERHSQSIQENVKLTYNSVPYSQHVPSEYVRTASRGAQRSEFETGPSVNEESGATFKFNPTKEPFRLHSGSAFLLEESTRAKILPSDASVHMASTSLVRQKYLSMKGVQDSKNLPSTSGAVAHNSAGSNREEMQNVAGLENIREDYRSSGQSAASSGVLPHLANLSISSIDMSTDNAEISEHKYSEKEHTEGN